MNATVGVRRAGSASPYTCTPGIARSSSSIGSNSAASAAASWSMPSSTRKRAAASTPAMASKLGIPVSKRDGPMSVDGRTLNTGSSASNDGSIQMTPLCGPYHL